MSDLRVFFGGVIFAVGYRLIVGALLSWRYFALSGVALIAGLVAFGLARADERRQQRRAA